MIAALAASASAIYAKDKTKPPAPKDEIQVVGHIPIADGPMTRFLPTQHYSSYYLYAEHASGKTVTLIDVTAAAHPAVLADVAYPAEVGSESLSVVAGTAALVSMGVTAGQPAASAAAPRPSVSWISPTPRIPKSPVNSPALRR